MAPPREHMAPMNLDAQQSEIVTVDGEAAQDKSCQMLHKGILTSATPIELVGNQQPFCWFAEYKTIHPENPPKLWNIRRFVTLTCLVLIFVSSKHRMW